MPGRWRRRSRSPRPRGPLSPRWRSSGAGIRSTPDGTVRAAGGTPRMRRRLVVLLLAFAVIVDLGAAVGIAVAAANDTGPVVVRTSAPPLAATDDVARGAAGSLQDPQPAPAARRSSAVPTRIVIPAISVDAPVQRLARNGAGVLQPPTLWASAGWYAAGVVPGD